jgi:ABC-2 type transport system permease protein
MVFFVLLTLIFYPSFKQDAAELERTFENIPDAALQLLGGSSDFFSPIGYINSQIYFIMLPLLLGIVAIGQGSNILMKEEQDKTIEGLLARPVSRSKLLFSKALSAITILSIITIVTHISILLISKIVDLEVSVSAMTQATFVCYLMCLSFGSIAFLLTATGKAKGASLGIATFIAFGGYIVASLAGTVSWLSTPSKLFPFNYYNPEAILRENYNWNNIWYFIGVIILCSTLSWFAFRRRDIA